MQLKIENANYKIKTGQQNLEKTSKCWTKNGQIKNKCVI